MRKHSQRGFGRFEGDCGARERKRKLAVEGDGRGEVLHSCPPLSQLRSRRHPFVCPRPPRGCATTTRRPESGRAGPRIGAGWVLVAKSITNLPPAHVSDGSQSSLCVIARGNLHQLFAYSVRVPLKQAYAEERSRSVWKASQIIMGFAIASGTWRPFPDPERSSLSCNLSAASVSISTFNSCGHATGVLTAHRLVHGLSSQIPQPYIPKDPFFS
jgi:hypothetical protein